ncbi:MAG: plasmid pRiA4b ORF-3 family protein [Deltaproteobacteria bacterium]|nr:plasmid pRiA4b ORF-3 family protein [Deltaproteobacteria bacterium]
MCTHTARGNLQYGDPTLIEDAPLLVDERTITLDDLTKTNSAFLYEYDFGDSWQHTITVKKVPDIDSNTVIPTCLAGQGACPPEDCGGPPAFRELLEILKSPDHPEHQEKVEWLGRNHNFDPEHFFRSTTNRRLRQWRIRHT